VAFKYRDFFLAFKTSNVIWETVPQAWTSNIAECTLSKLKLIAHLRFAFSKFLESSVVYRLSYTQTDSQFSSHCAILPAGCVASSPHVMLPAHTVIEIFCRSPEPEHEPVTSMTESSRVNHLDVWKGNNFSVFCNVFLPF